MRPLEVLFSSLGTCVWICYVYVPIGKEKEEQCSYFNSYCEKSFFSLGSLHSTVFIVFLRLVNDIAL